MILYSKSLFTGIKSTVLLDCGFFHPNGFPPQYVVFIVFIFMHAYYLLVNVFLIMYRRFINFYFALSPPLD